MKGQALVQLADIANCLSGDFHTMHLNYADTDFDIMHKQVLKEYYEQAAEDYDTWSEAALMFDDLDCVPSQNGCAQRIEWQSFEGACNHDIGYNRSKDILLSYLASLVVVYKLLNALEDAVCVGVTNTLQTRIEYWSKELLYFNARRQ